MHIALFGASFNPPHTAHRIITEQLLDQGLVDQVWLVPVKQHPFGKKILDQQQRLQMVMQMVWAINRPNTVLIEAYELNQAKPSYSFVTLTAMAKKFPNHTFSWVIGSDNLSHFPEWYEAQQLLKQFSVYVYPRKGSATDQLLPGMKLITGVSEIDISSTEIRSRIKRGQDITSLVDPEIAQYIKENELYVS